MRVRSRDCACNTCCNTGTASAARSRRWLSTRACSNSRIAALGRVRLERGQALEHVGERVRIVAPQRERLQEAQRVGVFFDLEQPPIRVGRAIFVLRVLHQHLRGAAQEQARTPPSCSRAVRERSSDSSLSICALEQVVELALTLGVLRQRDEGLDCGRHAFERERREALPCAVDVLELARRELCRCDRGTLPGIGIRLEPRERGRALRPARDGAAHARAAATACGTVRRARRRLSVQRCSAPIARLASFSSCSYRSESRRAYSARAFDVCARLRRC